jgi:hypothetical protein
VRLAPYSPGPTPRTQPCSPLPSVQTPRFVHCGLLQRITDVQLLVIRNPVAYGTGAPYNFTVWQ